MGRARRRLMLMAALFEKAPREISQAAAVVYKKWLKEHAPKRTGALGRSIIYRTFPNMGGWGVRFYALSYSAFVILGTQPHVISARIKKALYWEGAAHPFVRVNHPGTQPNDFREKAAESAYPEIALILRSAGIKVVEESRL